MIKFDCNTEICQQSSCSQIWFSKPYYRFSWERAAFASTYRSLWGHWPWCEPVDPLYCRPRVVHPCRWRSWAACERGVAWCHCRGWHSTTGRRLMMSPRCPWSLPLAWHLFPPGERLLPALALHLWKIKDWQTHEGKDEEKRMNRDVRAI